MTISKVSNYKLMSANNYSLPTATDLILGGVKIGSGISITTGIISADTQSDENFTTILKNKLDGIEVLADVTDGVDSDIDSVLLEVTQFVIGGTPYPIVSGADNTATIAGVGDVTIASDGSLTFVPVLNYNGIVPTITYTLTDGADTDLAVTDGGTGYDNTTTASNSLIPEGNR